MADNPNQSHWTRWHTLGLFAILILVAVLGVRLPADPTKYVVGSWIANMLLLTFFLVVAGQGITGRWVGLLIDEQNTMSLSRLQMILWTIVVLSGFLTAAITNIHRGQADPLSIAMQNDLWILMGISTTSLVGSPLIKSTKRDAETNTDEQQKTLALMAKQGVDPQKVRSQGKLIANNNIEDARWSDLFRGEEVGNAGQLDLGKIQMFYFTLIILMAYAVSLGSMFSSTAGKIASFPNLHQSMITLLGISHAGYLVNKAAPHTPSAPAKS